MVKEIEGIVISAIDYKENSKILNILTEHEGIIGVIAKGCKNHRNKLAFVSNILTYGVFYLNYYKGSVPILTDVDVKNNFKVIRKDIVRTNYAVFLLELVSQIYRHDNVDKVYDLLINGLIKINEGYDAQIITNIIELKLLENLGIKPEVERCVNCGKTTDIVTISSYKGGYLCNECVNNEPIFHLKTISLIRTFYYVQLSKISKIEITNTIKRELNAFIDDYYERYSGLYLKSKRLVESISFDGI